MSYVAYYKHEFPRLNLTDANHPTDDTIPTEASPDSTTITQPSDSDLPNLLAPGEEEPTSSPPSPEQEVVDVESYQPQPCVVDLTSEDEDDVDVVAVVPREQAVIYLGTELRRHNVRRRNANETTVPPALENLTRPERRHRSVFESGGGQEGSTTIMPPVESLQNQWIIDTPTLDFGDLLDFTAESVDHSHAPRRPNPLREFRHRRQGSRSRSPQHQDSRDATGTPELLQDLDELIAECEERMPPPHVLGGQMSFVRSAEQIVAQEHSQRVAQISAPQAPPSPPPREQPTISCLVCLDSVATIQNSPRNLCSTVCGHLFCSTCIEQTVRLKKQCPVCRKKLTRRQYHQVFI